MYQNETRDFIQVETWFKPGDRTLLDFNFRKLPKQLPQTTLGKIVKETSKNVKWILFVVFAVTILINFLAENDLTIIMKTFIFQLSFEVHLIFLWNAQISSPVQVMFKYLLPFVMYDVADLLENINEDYSIEYLF